MQDTFPAERLPASVSRRIQKNNSGLGEDKNNIVTPQVFQVVTSKPRLKTSWLYGQPFCEP
jgi:hypothetical protein